VYQLLKLSRQTSLHHFSAKALISSLKGDMHKNDTAFCSESLRSRSVLKRVAETWEQQHQVAANKLREGGSLVGGFMSMSCC